jgi:hypothetical protein
MVVVDLPARAPCRDLQTRKRLNAAFYGHFCVPHYTSRRSLYSTITCSKVSDTRIRKCPVKSLQAVQNSNPQTRRSIRQSAHPLQSWPKRNATVRVSPPLPSLLVRSTETPNIPHPHRGLLRRIPRKFRKSGCPAPHQYKQADTAGTDLHASGLKQSPPSNRVCGQCAETFLPACASYCALPWHFVFF